MYLEEEEDKVVVVLGREQELWRAENLEKMNHLVRRHQGQRLDVC